MTYIMALDQGTSSSRSIVFDLSGNIVSSAQKEFTQYYPQSGRVEHDADEIWKTQLDTAREAFGKSGLRPADIAAIGIANQRETVVVWDRKSGNPLHKAIVWQDRRTAKLVAQMKADGMEPTLQKKTGLPADPYFSGSKIKWLLQTYPEIKEKMNRGHVCFGTVDTWLVYNLTRKQRFVTDISNASRTQLMNIDSGWWDDELIRLMDVSKNALPDILSNNGYFGETDILGRSIPIYGMAGDQQAALFGQRCFTPGDVKNTYGTGCFILVNTGGKRIESKNRLLTTVAWKLGGNRIEYALEGGVFVAGAAVQWLRDGLNVIQSAPEVEALAERVPDTDGVYVVPAFTGLGAPYWNPDTRGAILGIHRGTTKAHIARAVLESVALQSEDVIRAMSSDLGNPIRSIRTDGGGSACNLLMSMQADFSGCDVIRPSTLETTALGAAFIAALGKGLFTSTDELSESLQSDRVFSPSLTHDERDKKMIAWKKAVKTTMSF